MPEDKKPHRQNLIVSGVTRDEVSNGVTYLVVPVVMLQEQVLFCSNCHPDGEFVSAAEIAAAADAWDGRPITLSHPSEAWTPRNHLKLEVGRVFNVRWTGAKLKGEMWLDVVKLRRSEKGRVAETRFRKGEVTEVSTGYFAARRMKAGTHNGVKYKIEQFGLIPDHLAILTDEIGACSIAGGCGAPRLNSQHEESMDEETKFLNRLKRGLAALLTLGGSEAETEEEKSTEGAGPVGNEQGNGSPAPTTGEGGSGEEKTHDGSALKMDEKQRKALVGRILASGKVSTFDEKGLLAMTDEQLKSLSTLTGCGCDGGEPGKPTEPVKPEVDNAGGKKPDEKDGADANAAGPQISAEDLTFVTQLRELSGGSIEGLSSLIEAGKTEAQRRETLKNNLVEQLKKDDRVAMSESVLKGMTLEALEGFDRSLNPLNYAGRGGPRITNSGGEDDAFAPDPPAIALNTEKAGDKTGGAA